MFKHWFGDWENDPKNASKVLDKNGEPRVVYHGTPNTGFTVFNTEGEGGSYNTGAFFTVNAAGRMWNGLEEISIYDNETGEVFYEYEEGDPFVSVGAAE